jgi:hypothetical protein
MDPTYIILSLVSVVACYLVARNNNRKALAWALLAVVLGPFAFIILFFTVKFSESKKKKCSSCGEFIKLEANKCKYCGEVLEEEKSMAES